MNFDFGMTKGAKEAGKVLTAGIHNATFKGISGDTINGKDGNSYKVMSLMLDIEGYGEFKHNFFEPTSADRTTSMFGENPSQLEHFMIAVRIILDALDPGIGERIDNGDIKFSGTFAQMVAAVKKLTTPYIDKEVQVKLLPQNNGFAAIPGFPARISKSGALGIGNKFMGQNLVLSDAEKRKIDAVKNATPTDMSKQSPQKSDDVLSSMSDDLDSDDGLDDLPF